MRTFQSTTHKYVSERQDFGTCAYDVTFSVKDLRRIERLLERAEAELANATVALQDDKRFKAVNTLLWANVKLIECTLGHNNDTASEEFDFAEKL